MSTHVISTSSQHAFLSSFVRAKNELEELLIINCVFKKNPPRALSSAVTVGLCYGGNSWCFSSFLAFLFSSSGLIVGVLDRS